MTASHGNHVPEGFGFRTGVRSEAVAVGFAVFVFVLGTLFVALGMVLAVGDGLWGWMVALAVFELAFIGAFAAMLHMARQRHRSR
ncbi:hypothetical protein LVY72_10805 [Arthrobacter sp. I2-34]|uniref:Uncharacterized protein n=1 Tax=Arthrobacter hankyongi TaxID=2904801 RepID=A0ABS9L703_9MICC|nr:hypothetical protein [Arthrobacter hankyongi]MCG2622401.1 hypothetical protein [Arthrobacter hankyongi]